MSFKQKTWKDRISEHPTRRTLTKEDGTTETVTVTREEGTISQEGDAYSAANMNDLEQRVADGFSTLSQDSVKIATKNTTSDSIAFGIDSNGNYGYIKEGADTVTPFKSQKDIDNAYNSGVSAADARVNTSSASYSSGYTNGKNATGFQLVVNTVLHSHGGTQPYPGNGQQSYTLTATEMTWWCAASGTDGTNVKCTGQGSGVLQAGESRSFTAYANPTDAPHEDAFVHIAAWVRR